MQVNYHNQFDKDLWKINNKLIIKKIFEFIDKLEISDYRIWFRYDEKQIILDRVLHRKDIYKKYPI